MQTETAKADVIDDIAVSGDPRVAVIGIGGAGCRVVSMLYNGNSNVQTIAINTDRAALEATAADKRLYICKEVTKGLGAFGDPELGRRCAKVHEEEIMSVVSGYDLAIVVAGLGGGTGTGAAPVVAELCQRVGAAAASIAIMPSSFESGREYKAKDGYRALHLVCKNMIKVKLDDVFSKAGMNMTIGDALSMVDRSIAFKIEDTVRDAKIIITEHVKKRASAIATELPEGQTQSS